MAYPKRRPPGGAMLRACRLRGSYFQGGPQKTRFAPNGSKPHLSSSVLDCFRAARGPSTIPKPFMCSPIVRNPSGPKVKMNPGEPLRAKYLISPTFGGEQIELTCLTKTRLLHSPDGCGVFDVDPRCRKLDAFVTRYKIEADIYSKELLPGTNPQIGNWPIYFGLARWRRRSMTGPGDAA
jgi:hypothetical protein